MPNRSTSKKVQCNTLKELISTLPPDQKFHRFMKKINQHSFRGCTARRKIILDSIRNGPVLRAMPHPHSRKISASFLFTRLDICTSGISCGISWDDRTISRDMAELRGETG